jgi:transposase
VPDARLLLDLLVKHREQLHAWRPSDAVTRALELLVEQRRAAVALQVELTQQLRAALKDYFPQALDWAGADLARPMAGAFLTQWPTLEAVQRARASTVRRFYTQHGCRRAAVIDARVAAIAQATPLTTDPALITSRALYVKLLAQQLLALGPSIAGLDAAIAEQFAVHPDAGIFDSFPGAGPVMAPRLLAAFGTERGRFRSAVAMQTHSGIAPITIRSARQCQVRWRWATSTFVRQTFHEFAQHSVPHCAWARAFYRTQRDRGKAHQTAIRTLAFKWIRILWKCWYDRVPYDNARYERTLALRHSPLTNQLPVEAVAA